MHSRGGFPVDHHATILALGAAAENLACALDASGLDNSAWSFGLPNAASVFARGPVRVGSGISLASGEQLWKRRHTNRFPYRSELAPTVAPTLGACGMGEVGAQLISGTGIRQVAQWVRRASEVRFQIREANEWFTSSLRYGDSRTERASGLHVSTLALPPGGVALLRVMSDWGRMQWLNRMRAFKFFAAIEAVNFQKAPLIVAIVGPTGPAAGFDAGRCLQRVWLKATELGLSAQPFYVVTDLLNRLESNGLPEHCVSGAKGLRARVHAQFGSGNAVHCLLRIGKPIKDIAVSGRLPLNEIMCDRGG